MEGAPKTDSSQKSARRVGYAKDNAKRPAADLHAAVFSRDQGWSIPVPANESVGPEPTRGRRSRPHESTHV